MKLLCACGVLAHLFSCIDSRFLTLLIAFAEARRSCQPEGCQGQKKVEANSKRGGGSQGGQEKGGRKRRKVGDEDEQTATSPSLQGGGKGKGKQAGNGKQLQRQVALEISGQGEGGVLEGGSDGDRTTFSHSGNTSDNLSASPPAHLPSCSSHIHASSSETKTLLLVIVVKWDGWIKYGF